MLLLLLPSLLWMVEWYRMVLNVKQRQIAYKELFGSIEYITVVTDGMVANKQKKKKKVSYNKVHSKNGVYRYVHANIHVT